MSIALLHQLDAIMPTGLIGSVVRISGVTAAAADFPAPIGAQVAIERQTGSPIAGEVIGFHQGLTLICPFGEMSGVRQGNRVHLRRTSRTIAVGENLLGRVIDAHGRAIDNRPQPRLPARALLHRKPPGATERAPISTSLSTGVRAIDGLLTCGRGQRVGVFAGSGVGKSVTLGMIARYTSAEVNVIGLIGERGREVNEFLERDLSPEARARSVVVVATSDEPALLRVQAALAATAVAEYFRDRGKQVLLIMDSLTRFAMAQREIGLAAGEPPTTRGYPPSVFATLPKLVERAGCGSASDSNSPPGSITAFYSVLVEGDDNNEPISDTVRGLLDGHIVLSRQIASRGHYPAIDVLASISRLMSRVASAEHLQAARSLRESLAIYRQNEDLIAIGAYAGGDPAIDAAKAMHEPIDQFLQQAVEDRSSVELARQSLEKLAAQAAALRRPSAATAAPPARQER